MIAQTETERVAEERAAFEAWFESIPGWHDRCARINNEEYLHERTFYAFAGWLARASPRRLVTDEQVAAGISAHDQYAWTYPPHRFDLAAWMRAILTAALTPAAKDSLDSSRTAPAVTEDQIDRAIEMAGASVKGWQQRDYTIAHAAAVAMADILGAAPTPIGKESLRTAWQPIATAPRDRDILVYAPPYDDLPYIVSNCRWHPDGGFCVDELRQVTMWRELPEPPTERGEQS